MSDTPDEVEIAYRRGFQQGAFLASEAAVKLSRNSDGLSRLRDWAGYALHRWRYEDRPNDRTVRPPPPPQI